MHESTIPAGFWKGTQSRALTAPFAPALAVAILAVLFLTVAAWNGFPLMFYDTGAYMAQGLGGAFMVERSPVYSLLLLFAGGGLSMWLVAGVQALFTAFIVTELARAEVPHLTLGGLVAIALGLMLLTGMGWYVGQIEPDCFTPLVVLGCYLLLFRLGGMSRARRIATVAITGLAVACHPSHLGLIGGLLIAAGLVWAARRWLPGLPRPRLLPGLAALGLALAMLLTANFALSGAFFISRSGSVFVFARLMQDGIVKRLLDETCPGREGGQAPYKLCAYKNRLATTANGWLWGENSAFHATGGFKKSEAEDERIIHDSLVRYPAMHVRAAIYESIMQFLMFKTGDGIESQAWVLKPGFQHMLPRQLPAYLAARQQREPIRFKTLNLVHVPIGVLSVLGLLLLLRHASVKRRWGDAMLPGMVLLGLIGNAIICGTFSNPHDRYQSRLIWTPVLVLFLVRARDPRALQPAEEAGR